jgi:hypothetical protein
MKNKFTKIKFNSWAIQLAIRRKGQFGWTEECMLEKLAQNIDDLKINS